MPGDDTAASGEAQTPEQQTPTAAAVEPQSLAPAAAPPWTLLCQCQSSDSYPEVVYAVLHIDCDQAAVLLGLRSTLESVRPLLPDASGQAIHVRDTRVRFACEFSPPYEEARVEWDLSPWHTVSSDPLSEPHRVHVEGDTIQITPYGISWSVSPTQDRYQIIQTDTLLWGHLEALAAGQSPFAHFAPEPLARPGGQIAERT
jgi:hypothetical protein